MHNGKAINEEMHTTCLHCGSVFRITTDQLDMADGQVRCSQCHQVFNALLTLESVVDQDQPLQQAHEPTAAEAMADLLELKDDTARARLAGDERKVTLNEAMYGDESASPSAFRQIMWIAAIVTLLVISVVQAVYYQRYQLIEDPRYQRANTSNRFSVFASCYPVTKPVSAVWSRSN